MSTTHTRGHQSAAADGPAVLVAAIDAQTGPLLAVMDWADDEITEASRRHPAQADLLFHAFSLLLPRQIGAGMGTEFVYRGHVRELLQRVAVGEDLRLATATEICLTLAQVSAVTPMHGAGAGLYFRMWLAAFGDHPVRADQPGNERHYEHLYGAQIDELEAELRRKIADPDRQLGHIACDGCHHGRPVSCRFNAADTTP
ncbi:hypothetical protein [Paractinoplanes rishiriensis]|nr:hypothetical protein [Actinoplanes rishiriensis]